MRAELSRKLCARAGDPNMVFLTGDLGFMALEPLRDVMGDRFINAGVAEQNMVAVAAAIALEGFDVWVYTIAPFCYARALEHVRNDICLHRAPVKLIGNGGGYGYGAMGPTHHALEDYGVLLTLPGMRVFVPAFERDIAPVVERAASLVEQPSYLRLGVDELPKDVQAPDYAPWRRLLCGEGPVMIVAGPLAGSCYAALREIPAAKRAELWVVTELPLESNDFPAALREALVAKRRLCVVEEHVAHGGLGACLSQWILAEGIALAGYRHLGALGYPSGLYGSQSFHRKEVGLDVDSIQRALQDLLTA